MLSLRELMAEYIMFAFTEEDLVDRFQVTEDELLELSDMDLLEIYDQTLLTPVAE